MTNAKRNAFLSDFLLSVTARGRALLGRNGTDADVAFSSAEALLQQCERLLSWRGEATAIALAESILAGFGRLDEAEQLDFLIKLNEQFGVDVAQMEKAITAWQATPTADHAADVHFAAEPRLQELLRRLNRAPDGTAQLVAMRACLMQAMRQHPDLKNSNRDFHHLFSSWFNRGFLELRRIDWSTSAAILDKLIQYEAVHAIKGWDDLRRRIDPADRLCYAFFHPSLRDDPLIFVEIALVDGQPGAIAPILADDRPQLAIEQANTAVFYSISNCQKGLRGVSFGNFLIKQVVQEIMRDMPQITHFMTLSPIPGFVRWVEQLSDDAPHVQAAREAVALYKQWPDSAENTLMPLVAHYFLHAKNKRGQPYDPVARFHLGNGARLENIHWRADASPNGRANACGMMVNYLYKVAYIEQNHEAYAYERQVIAADTIYKLQKQLV